MLKSVLSQFKDDVHVLPVKILTRESLFEIIKKVILGLKNIRFRVLTIITDNTVINRKAVSYFLSPPKLQLIYQHPADKNRPLFYIFVSIHLLKYNTNSWLHRKKMLRNVSFIPISVMVTIKINPKNSKQLY